MKRPLAIEAAARRDLAALPAQYRNSAVGKAYLLLARTLDAGVPARDKAVLTREMRLCLDQLLTLAPPSAAGDFADELKARRETKMTEIRKQAARE